MISFAFEFIQMIYELRVIFYLVVLLYLAEKVHTHRPSHPIAYFLVDDF